MLHPETLGPYRVEGVIGSGGMGIVYRAEAPDGRKVALKTLLPHMLEEHQRGRFEREGSIRVDHPNVIALVDAGTAENGAPYIALELLSGRSLEERLRESTLEAAELIDVLRQACRGLAAVHAAGIVHRDLKPANIFCCDDGTVKVLDFGIAQVAGGPKLTVEGTVLGSVSYLSPEQARGRSDIDPTTDVWAMGVVMYEALTGTAPFDRDTPLTTILQIIQGNYVRLEQRAPHIPRPLCEIVDRCLQRSPTARYPNGAALVSAMESLDALDTSRISVPTGETQFVRVSLPPGEERIVVVLLARGARSPQAIEAAITELGGEAIPFLGEGVIGLFGGTSWEGDEIERAVEAALRCREAADSVAVGSGRVRSTGSDVSGAAVMAAERGCQAHLDGVALDAPTARTLAGRFELVNRADGLVEVTARRRDSSVAAPLSSSSALGRDLELARIRAAVEACRAGGTPQVVEVIGPLGIGKSKLRAEMLRMLAPGVTVLTGRGEPMRADVALHLWGSVLARHLRAERPDAEDDASRAEAIDRLATETLEDEHGAVVHAAFLRELLGVPGAEPAPLLEARADPQLMSDRLRLTILDFVGALARRGPLAIVLEDLQWADRASIELLERLGDDLAGLPVLIFLTSRQPVVDTEMGGLSELPVDRIELSGLPRAAARELALAAAGVDLPEPVLDELAQRSEGNPFFLEQMAIALREQGELEEHGLADVPLPTTVEAALQSRLDRLPKEARELARRASVLRRAFLPEEVEALGAGDAAANIEVLVHREILQRTEDGLAFRSPLVAKVVYDLLTPEMRIELHALAASYLEHARGVDPEEAAVHHERAGATLSAASCYGRSALAAARRGDLETVLRCSGRAFELGVPEGDLHELHMARANALRFLGRRGEQEQQLEAALAHAKDDVERGRALTEKISLLSWLGRRAEAEQVAREAVRVATSSGDAEALVRALCLSAEMLILGGRHDDAEGPLREAARAARDQRPRLRADVLERRALLADARGDLGQALQWWEKALEQLHASGALRRAAAAQQNLAECFNRLGACELAEPALREALEGCRRTGHRVHEAYAMANLGNALARLARVDEALDVLRDAEALARGMRDDRLLLYVRAYRATALSTARRWQEAVDTATATAHDAREQGRKALEVIALSVAAIAQLELGRTDEALASSERALALRDELGGLDEREGEVFLARALALSAADRHEEAAAVRERGRERVREIARRIRDDAWRERFLADVAGHRALLA